MKTGNVQELFSQAAAEFAHSTAIEHRGRAVSYRELEDDANALANFIVSAGTPRGSVVALLAHSPVHVITAVLAVLKAGCIFVPLDPATPDLRLSLLLEEVEPTWLVTDSELLARLCAVAAPLGRCAEVVCLGGAGEQVACPPPLVLRADFAAHADTSPVQVAADPDDACYVYFTSGSTGRPKGIVGRLKGIDHFIRWEAGVCGVVPGTRVSQLTSPAFDAFLRDVFTPLCAGGTVCAPDGREDILDPRRLVAWLDSARVNLVHCVPSLFRSILNEEPRPEQFLALRHVLLSGEPLLPSDVGRWVATFGERVQLINLYGPTETTMTKFFYPVQAADRELRRIPIGKPMEGARALVVDAKGRVCRPGSVGEVYIRTPYRTHGYWRRPDLTREVFIPNPFGQDPNDLVYKTGDLARVLKSGDFEFLGRQDHQVKVRGVRVELGEIQELLRAHEAVRDVAVVDLEDAGGNKYLCAYVVGMESAEVGRLREYLMGRLPEYMVPTAYVALESLPRTISGKLDRKALPMPAQARPRAPYVAPRNRVEEVIAGLWVEVLGVERVGVGENFFELGGHSLLATQLLSRVRAAFRAEVPLRSLFREPTVEGLARGVEEALRSGAGTPAAPILPAPRTGPLPTSFAQQRLWFLQQMEPDNVAHNMPVAVRLHGRLDADALNRTLSEITRRHEVLRTTFSQSHAGLIQVISDFAPPALPVTDITHLPEQEREIEARRLMQTEALLPFDLSEGSLLRASLLRLSPTEHILLCTMHHVVSDGWSMGVLIREVGALYEAFSAGLPSPLPELPIQYADYAAWQRAWMTDETLEGELAYWRERLAGAPATLDLPSDRPRPVVRRYDGATHTFTLSPEVLKSVRELSHRESATPFMTLLASFLAYLHKETGQEDLVVGTDIAGRTRSEVEPLIGFFINQLALRTDVSGDPSFGELLRRVREVTLGAYAHQDLPFEKVVEELQPDRKLSRTPLFQVLFVVQNAPFSSLRLSDLTLSPVELDEPTSKFDLILMFIETPDGLLGKWRYSTDLFEAATIERLTRRWQTLLAHALAEPDARLSRLDTLTKEEKAEREEAERKRAAAGLSRFRSVRPKPVSLPEVDMIKKSFLTVAEKLPLVIEPNAEHVDLAEWVRGERAHLDALLSRHAALLFRGFSLNSTAAFERFADAACPSLYSDYGDLPRGSAGGRVYSSTPYPPDQPILFHNESSHLHSWPMKIMFCCLKPPARGGQTPLADCREVYRLLDPRLREEFERRGLRYVRNFTDGLDVAWQEFFHTGERAEVERRCREAGIDCEWLDGGGLRTSKAARAVTRHPRTGEAVVFNQVQAHHASFLRPEVRESLLRLYGERGLPRNVYYGDGGVIPDAVMAEVAAVYERAAVEFEWEEGDAVLVDNMLAAHGRRAYEGERRVVVAMGEMITEPDLVQANLLLA
jgi:amino acid adenylation domain-containing protein